MDTSLAPTTGPEIVRGAIDALGEATPAEISEWYETAFGDKPPVTDSTLRQTVTRLNRAREIASIPTEHGKYRYPNDEDRARWAREDEEERKRPHVELNDTAPPPQPSPGVVLFRIRTPDGRVIGEWTTQGVQVSEPLDLVIESSSPSDA